MAQQTTLRKRLAAIREVLRAPLRPGGQSEQVLRTLERMRTAQRAAEEEDKKAYRFRFSPVTVGIALAVMGATVGWAYFMGYMVGLGQNPARQVARLTGTPPQPAPQVVAQATLPPDIIKEDIPPEGTVPAQAAAPQAGKDATPAPSAAGKDAAPASSAAGKAPAGKTATAEKKDSTKDASKYPFARPRGQSLDAWGISANAAAPKQATPAAQPAAEKKAPASGQQLYDFVFQVAAFRKQEDADRLCRRLEEKGIRCRVQSSGKVMLTLALLRGTALDGANLRAECQRMGLGAPIQRSRKELKGRVRQ